MTTARLALIALALLGCRKKPPIVGPPEDPGRPVAAIPEPEPTTEAPPAPGPYPTASFAEIALADAGARVVPGGDIDGDGLADLLIGLPERNRVQIAFGASLRRAAAGTAWVPDRVLTTKIATDRVGAGVAGVGDVDGDGLGDVLIGAPGAVGPGGGFGGAWLMLGRTLRDDPSAGLDQAWCYYWGARLDTIGAGLASLGDLDGDGRAEALFPGYRLGYVVTGAQLAAYEELYLPDVATQLAGVPEGHRFEVRAEPAGDTRGDGWGGALVSWPAEDGRVWLFHGSQMGRVLDLGTDAWGRFDTPGTWQGDLAAAVDLNGDGRPDPIVGWIDAQPVLAAIDAGHLAAPTRIDAAASAFLVIESDPRWAIHDVASLGDLDGDGTDEMAVGTRMEGPAEGARVFVFRGRSLRGVERTSLASADHVFDYDVDPNFWWTTEVIAPGDLDGDKVGDLVVTLRGFSWDDPSHTAAPRAFVHLSPWRER